MKLKLAIAIARQQTDPNFKGYKFTTSGIYLARNGQYMTGPKNSFLYKLARRQWTWEQFLVEFDHERRRMVSHASHGHHRHIEW